MESARVTQSFWNLYWALVFHNKIQNNSDYLTLENEKLMVFVLYFDRQVLVFCLPKKESNIQITKEMLTQVILDIGVHKFLEKIELTENAQRKAKKLSLEIETVFICRINIGDGKEYIVFGPNSRQKGRPKSLLVILDSITSGKIEYNSLIKKSKNHDLLLVEYVLATRKIRFILGLFNYIYDGDLIIISNDTAIEVVSSANQAIPYKLRKDGIKERFSDFGSKLEKFLKGS